MNVGRVAFIQLLAVSLALALVACPAQQTPTPRGETPEASAEESEEPEETEEPEATADETEETEEPEDTEAPEETDELSGGDDLGDYEAISHDEAEMTVTVPRAWSDVNTGDLWSYGGEFVGYTMSASPDIPGFKHDEFEVPGVFFGASEMLVGELTPEELLDEGAPPTGVESDNLEECEYAGREEYTDPAYTGVRDLYTDCADTGAEFLMIAAEANDGSHVVLVQVTAVTDEDRDARDGILETFFARDLPPPPEL